MSKLTVNGDVDLLIKYIDSNIDEIDYNNWTEDCMLTETLISELSEKQIVNLESEISDSMSANMYYLTMKTKSNYSVFVKDTEFGAKFDIVDLDSMKGIKRYYYARLDLVTESLIKKYPKDIIIISKLLQSGEFDVTSDDKFEIGGYTID